MTRPRRDLKVGYCYHITVRCNNREFRLTRLECREVLLYAIKRAQENYQFKLYALCIMSNQCALPARTCSTRRFTSNHALD